MDREAFLARVGEYRAQGLRLALINVTTIMPAAAPVHGARPEAGGAATPEAGQAVPADDTPGDVFEVAWVFENDRDATLATIREQVGPADVIPSVSAMFGAAFLYENEMRELFGLTVEGINLDLQGQLYKTATRVPFSHAAVKARLEALTGATAAPAGGQAAAQTPAKEARA